MAHATPSPSGSLVAAAGLGRWDGSRTGWAVVMNDGPAAEDLATHLGGRAAAQPRAGAAGFEVLLDTDSIEVELCEPVPNRGLKPTGTLLLRLAHARKIGVFELASTHWEVGKGVRKLMEEGSDRLLSARFVLSIATRVITTRSGTMIRYVQPQLALQRGDRGWHDRGAGERAGVPDGCPCSSDGSGAETGSAVLGVVSQAPSPHRSGGRVRGGSGLRSSSPRSDYLALPQFRGIMCPPQVSKRSACVRMVTALADLRPVMRRLSMILGLERMVHRWPDSSPEAWVPS